MGIQYKNYLYIMYNNVGHKTVRGTGTNGYIQRNLAFLPKERERLPFQLQQIKQKLTSFPKERKPNEALIQRYKKRAIESIVYDLRCSLEDQKFHNSEIMERCQLLRDNLQIKLNRGESVIQNNQNSHEIASSQLKKNELLRMALGIDSKYKHGSSFKQDLQEEKKKREKRRKRER